MSVTVDEDGLTAEDRETVEALRPIVEEVLGQVMVALGAKTLRNEIARTTEALREMADRSEDIVRAAEAQMREAERVLGKRRRMTAKARRRTASSWLGPCRRPSVSSRLA